MKKFLTTAFIVAFGAFVLSAAKAEVSLSGYQEFYMGSADQTTQNSFATSTGASTNTNFNGFSNGRFTRLIAVGTTTLDSGIEVTGTYTLSKDNDIIVNKDWVVSITEPLDSVKKNYEDKVNGRRFDDTDGSSNGSGSGASESYPSININE